MPTDRPEDELTLLRRMARFKAPSHGTGALAGGEMLEFFKVVQKRQPKLEAVARAWETLVPEMFQRHTCLEGLNRGTLTVLVDSSSHLYELRQLLLAGLEKQLAVACKTAGVKKVSLKRGQWYDERTGAPKF